MALYQPTNQIPSSYTQGTVDAEKDTMEISWQVNGNSAMTAFQIDFFFNDTASTFVASTGRLTNGCPFYGTDRFGKPQFFTWSPSGQTWSDWSMLKPMPFTNGNNYKYKITQWYQSSESVVSVTPSVTLQVNTNYYFELPNNGGYISYVPSKVYAANLTTFYYNIGRRKGWSIANNTLEEQPMAYLTSLPSGASITATLTTDSVASSENFLTQYSFSVFITRSQPTVTIYQCTDDTYADYIDFPNDGTIATSVGYFHAEYTQAQNDPIRWVRWQVASATYNTETNKWALGEILADTGDIYTPTLNYEYNGFFNGSQYAIRCLGLSESEQSTNNPLSTNDNWIFFNIDIPNQGEYTGALTVKCLNKENAALLEWEPVTVITPTISPADYEPTISNGTVTLEPKDTTADEEYSVSWNSKGEVAGQPIPLDFTAPWTAVWKAKLDDRYSIVRRASTVASCVSFSPDGKTYVEVVDVSNVIVYSVDNSTVTYIGVLPNIQGTFRAVTCLAFSPDGKTLVVGGRDGSYNGHVLVYSVNGSNITYSSELTNTYNDFGVVTCLAFSANGRFLYVGGSGGESFKGYVLVYSVNGANISYVQTLNGTPFNNEVYSLAISPSNDVLVVGGFFANRALIYTGSGANMTLYGTVPQGTTNYTAVRNLTFSPDGSLLIVGGVGGFSGQYGRASVCSVSGANITYVDDIKPNSGSIFSSGIVNVSFSPDGTMVALGGQIYYIEGTDIKFMDSRVNSPSQAVAFSSDERMLSIGGNLYYLICSNQGYLFSISPLNLTITRDAARFKIMLGETVLASFIPPYNVQSLAVIISPTEVSVKGYFENALFSDISIDIQQSQWQETILGVSIYGGDSGTTVDTVSIYRGDGGRVVGLYNDSGFEPVWNNDSYQLYMSADFTENLEGGNVATKGTGFRVYRQEIGKNILTPVATVLPAITAVKDFGIVSGKVYKYLMYVYDQAKAFMKAVEAPNNIGMQFKSHDLLVCDYDETNDEYHVRKQYLFALNLSTGSVGNNNSPTLNANFTRYPTRMPSTQNYASGTLSGLIGAIYTVPALIEQIGNYKWTAKPSTLDYFDSVDLERELYDLSTAPYQLFLRDMKGRLRMVHTSGAISMTTNIKQKQQSISISFPWVEVGDASDVTIIQTPGDDGWNNDSQVLDISLDVDTSTGELSATYPFPYNDTKFYLTGVNKENLTAKTPLGITPAQFELSNTATKATDGNLNAIIK